MPEKTRAHQNEDDAMLEKIAKSSDRFNLLEKEMHGHLTLLGKRDLASETFTFITNFYTKGEGSYDKLAIGLHELRGAVLHVVSHNPLMTTAVAKTLSGDPDKFVAGLGRTALARLERVASAAFAESKKPSPISLRV